MNDFTAIITCHKDMDGLLNIFRQLSEQEQKPDIVECLVSDLGFTVEELLEIFSDYNDDFKINFYVTENFNDYGHYKRRKGLEYATTEWCGFFNCDDLYDKSFIKELMLHVEGNDLVFCDFISHNTGPSIISSTPRIGRITSGSFIIRTTFARSVGYNHDSYDGDGRFIEDLMIAGAKCFHVEKHLYTHL